MVWWWVVIKHTYKIVQTFSNACDFNEDCYGKKNMCLYCGQNGHIFFIKNCQVNIEQFVRLGRHLVLQ